MIETPWCYENDCAKFVGAVREKEHDESTEKLVCKAYPKKIPDGIALGNVRCEFYVKKS